VRPPNLLLSFTLVSALVLTATAPSSASAGPLVVCLGDSLTEGYGIDPAKAYPVQLQKLLQDRGWTDVEIVNAGISGSTSASGRARLQWQLLRRPDVVIVALGANDGLRGVELAATQANLSEVIELAKNNGLAVLLAGMKLPPNYGSDYTTRFEKMFIELAEEHEVTLLPFLLDGVAARPELNLPDGIHPNAEGYAIVAETVAKWLTPILEKLKREQAHE